MIRAALTSLLCMTAAAAPAQDLDFFTVGSGNVSGAYFSAARSICERINRFEAGRMRCSPEPTPGSIYNLRMLAQGELDMAFTQSDWQQAAYAGTDMFTGDAAIPEMQGVASLFPETLTLLVRGDVPIESVADLAGKSFDIGRPGSGRNASLSRLMALLSIEHEVFGRVEELEPATAIDDLCAGRLDATILITGHPNAIVARALRNCDVRLMDFRGPSVDGFLGNDPSFSQSLIPLATYPQLTSDIRSWAVTATVVARADTDARTVEAFVASLLANLPMLARTNPLFAGLTHETMRTRGMSAPLHPGAIRAFDAFATPMQ
jgi:TRAP transporter TAXI family solute receptor